MMSQDQQSLLQELHQLLDSGPRGQEMAMTLALRVWQLKMSQARSRSPIATLYMYCHGCAKTVLDDSTNMGQCNDWAVDARRHAKSHNPYMTTQITHTLAAGAIAFTVAPIAAEAMWYTLSAAPDTYHGTKHAGFAMMTVIICMSIGTASGEDWCLLLVM